MLQVWKFVLQPEIEISLPRGAELLSVASQGNDICLWAKVNPEAEKEKRSFVAFGTGHQIPDDLNLKFIGTAMIYDGSLVFHVFERI